MANGKRMVFMGHFVFIYHICLSRSSNTLFYPTCFYLLEQTSQLQATHLCCRSCNYFVFLYSFWCAITNAASQSVSCCNWGKRFLVVWSAQVLYSTSLCHSL